MNKELEKLKELYLFYKKRVGHKVCLKEEGLQPNEKNYYIIGSVNLVKAKDKNFYIMIYYKNRGNTSDKIEIFNKYGEKVSFAEFCYFNDISLIDYIETKKHYRNNGLATRAILKIEDISKNLKKCKNIKLVCSLRMSKDYKNLNLKFYEDLGFKKINPKDGELKPRIYMIKNLNKLEK